MKASKAAFSLIEILGVLAVMAILVGIAAGPTLKMIERARQEAEVRLLERMADDIKASFQNSDLARINISALAGVDAAGKGIDIADQSWSTIFDTSYAEVTDAAHDATTGDWWFIRLARLRGAEPDGTVVAAMPLVQNLIQNVYYRPRILVREPRDDTALSQNTSQRYMLISIMAPSHRDFPVEPSYLTTKAGFDLMWSTDWDNGQFLPFGGEWSVETAPRMKIIRITQQRYKLTINNTSGVDQGYVYYNGNGTDGSVGTPDFIVNSSSTLPSAPAANQHSSPWTIPVVSTEGVWSGRGILAGRRVMVARGPVLLLSAVPSIIFDFNLNENSTVTIQ